MPKCKRDNCDEGERKQREAKLRPKPLGESYHVYYKHSVIKGHFCLQFGPVAAVPTATVSTRAMCREFLFVLGSRPCLLGGIITRLYAPIRDSSAKDDEPPMV